MSNEKLQNLMTHIAAAQAAAIVSQDIVKDELVFTVKREAVHGFIAFLKSDAQCQFQQLVDVCGADYPARGPQRFDVVYNLLSLRLNQRVRVKAALAEGENIQSVVDLYAAAGWFEREAWDLYGIVFEGNPDLRRILTDTASKATRCARISR